jgi:uncharacterized membrane protein
MIIALGIILVLLLFVIGGERGIISSVTLFFNIVVLSVSIILMSWGWNAMIVTFISCLLISYITLFYQNGENAKTLASFWAVTAVLLLLFLISSRIGYVSHIRGINEMLRAEDDIFIELSPDIHISMAKVAVSIVVIGLVGAALDASIAVSSAIYEVFKGSRHLTIGQLFKSGINIGSDILGAMVNTLYFAFLGESLTLFILFKDDHYSVQRIINSKAFSQEMIYVILSCISCVLVVPITSIMISYILKNPIKLRRFLTEDELFKDPVPGSLNISPDPDRDR